MPTFKNWVSTTLPIQDTSSVSLSDILYVIDQSTNTSKQISVSGLLLGTNVIDVSGNPRGGVAGDGEGIYDPVSFWEAIKPDVLEVDYIQTSDQAGFTIPDYSFSRKGQVPYFGNSPIVVPSYYCFAIIENTTTGSTQWSRPLIEIPVSAGEIDEGNFFYLDFDLQIQYSNQITPGLIPNVLGIFHQQEFDTINPAAPLAGFQMIIDPLNLGDLVVVLKGSIILQGTSGGVFSTVTSGSLERISYSSPSTLNRVIQQADVDYFAGIGSGPSSPQVAENLIVSIYPPAGVGTLSACAIYGRLSFGRINVLLP